MNTTELISSARLRLCWTLALILSVNSLVISTAADESDTPEETPKAVVFTVPDGNAAELFQFINQVKQTPGPDGPREAIIAHMKNQVHTVSKACDKIMQLKPNEDQKLQVVVERLMGLEFLSQVDESSSEQLDALLKKHADDQRPEIQKMVGGITFKRRVAGAQGLSDQDLAGLVTELCQYIDTHGLDQRLYTLASGLGDSLEQSANPQLGAVIYEQLAKSLAELKQPGLEPQVARMKAVARRLKLPGNFMQIKGTTAEGEVFDWDSYRGKVVLVDFWASWCGPCRAEIPNMKAQLEAYGDKGFAIVGVNLDSTLQAYRQIVEAEELSWVNLMSQNEAERGWEHPLAVYYGISGIPTAILVDQEGKVVSMRARGGELNRLLAQLLGEPKPADGDGE